MTVWILRQTLTAEEEASIQKRTELILPFEDLPDLSLVGSEAQARKMMAMLHPDEPPEAITRRVDQFWPNYSQLQVEDIIAVPLNARQEMALAEVKGGYRYAVTNDARNLHTIPVLFHSRMLSFSRLRKYKDVLSDARQWYEVKDRVMRIAIRDQLPYGYNRFAKWKWLLILFFLIGVIRLLSHHH